MQDHQLMEQFAGGDYSAFEALYRRHKDILYRFLLRQLNPALAEDLCQDIWLKVVNARHSYSADASFRTWLYTIANNRLKDHWRQQGRHQPANDAEQDSEPEDQQTPTPEQQLHNEQQGQSLLRLIRQLPEEQRTCFLMRHEAGLSFGQIAQITGTNSEASKSRMRYAIARLRSGLEKIYG